MSLLDYNIDLKLADKCEIKQKNGTILKGYDITKLNIDTKYHLYVLAGTGCDFVKFTKTFTNGIIENDKLQLIDSISNVKVNNLTRTIMIDEPNGGFKAIKHKINGITPNQHVSMLLSTLKCNNNRDITVDCFTWNPSIRRALFGVLAGAPDIVEL